MKHTLLTCSLLLATTVLFAQRSSVQMGTLSLEGRALNSDRAVTDTIAPGSWADDPTTQLTRWGALCGPDTASVNCGYILGTNGYGDKAKAQMFLLDDPSTLVEGLIFWFYAKDGNPDAVVNARIYDTNGNGTMESGPVTSGAPGTILADKTFTLADVDTTETNGFTTVMFDGPVYVNTQFAAGFDFSSLGATDSLGLLGTSNGEPDFYEFSWEKWSNNAWNTLVYAWGNDLNIDLCVFALVDNSSVGIDSHGAMNHMRMSFLNGNISQGTVVLGYDVVSSGNMSLIVHNTKGGIVHEQALGEQAAGNYQTTFNTDGWASSNYFVTLMHNGRPLTKRMFVP